MGQAVSSAASLSWVTRRDRLRCCRHRPTGSVLMSPPAKHELADSCRVNEGMSDRISDLPDECLGLIFQCLSPCDRTQWSLVSRRWLEIEGLTRQRLSLKAKSDLFFVIPNLFERFNSVTKLSLRCDRKSISIGDDALILISLRCQSLTRLKLRACRQLTDAGMAALAINCRNLKKLSCGSCTFGMKGMNAFLQNCSTLEELSVKRLHSTTDAAPMEPVGPGSSGSSLRAICLKELCGGHCFGPLVTGSRNLKILKILKCGGDWDQLLASMSEQDTGLLEIHLEWVQVTDSSLSAISNFRNLEVLRLVKTPECTNRGLASIADRCKLLRKLHIDGWRNGIGDEGMLAVAKSCRKLQELVLISVNPTHLSLQMLATECLNLERLALCGCATVGDLEISCIAAKCQALKKLCIKSCPVSDFGMKALASGCPNLVKVKVKKCREVTVEGVGWLRSNRELLAINIDTDELAHHYSNGGDDECTEISPATTSFPHFSTLRERLSLPSLGFIPRTWRRWSTRSNTSSLS